MAKDEIIWSFEYHCSGIWCSPSLKTPSLKILSLKIPSLGKPSLRKPLKTPPLKIPSLRNLFFERPLHGESLHKKEKAFIEKFLHWENPFPARLEADWLKQQHQRLILIDEKQLNAMCHGKWYQNAWPVFITKRSATDPLKRGTKC